MGTVDPRLVSAIREQLRRQPRSAQRVGWKVGRGDRERIGDEIAVGHLTSATTLEPGRDYANAASLHADAEIALELGERHTIRGYGPALELVDLGVKGDAESIVAGNIFHRAVAFGPVQKVLPSGLDATLVVGSVVRAAAPVVEDFADTVVRVARILAEVGESLSCGDRLITGSIVQVAVSRGDDVVADFGPLGRVRVAIA